ELAREAEHHFLQLAIADGVAERIARRRQVVEVAAARQLDGLERRFGGGAADHDRQVIRRTGGGAELPQLAVEELHQRLAIEQRLRLLEEEGLVGGSAALGDEKEAVLVAVDGIQLDLRRKVAA